MFGAMTAPINQLSFSHYYEHRKTPVCQSLCCCLCEWLCNAFKEAWVQSRSEAESQRKYYDCKANAISLEPGDLVLAKADAYKGRRKVKDWWEEELYEVKCRIAEGVPSFLMKNQQTRHSWVLHWNWLFLSMSIMGAPLCGGVDWVEKVHHHHPGGAYLEGEWEWRSAKKCKVSVAGPAPDRWESCRVDQ